MRLAQPQHVGLAADLHSHSSSRMTAGPIVNLVFHAGIACRVIGTPAHPCHDPMLDKCAVPAYSHCCTPNHAAAPPSSHASSNAAGLPRMAAHQSDRTVAARTENGDGIGRARSWPGPPLIRGFRL